MSDEVDEFGPNRDAVAAFLKELRAYPWLSKETGDLAEAQPLVDAYMKALGLGSVPVRFSDWRAIKGSVARNADWAASKDAAGFAGALCTIRPTVRVAWDAARSAVACSVWVAAEDPAWAILADKATASDARVATRAAWAAGVHAMWLAAADPLSGTNPFAPLMALWRLGYYVGGVKNGEFVLGVRKP